MNSILKSAHAERQRRIGDAREEEARREKDRVVCSELITLSVQFHRIKNTSIRTANSAIYPSDNDSATTIQIR